MGKKKILCGFLVVNVGNFFSNFVGVRWTGDHPQEDLLKFHQIREKGRIVFVSCRGGSHMSAVSPEGGAPKGVSPRVCS